MKYSVIIPLYNKEHEIEDTLNSVLRQTYPDYEVIVVNDGSTDDSLSVAQKFQSERLRIINQDNRGVATARNTGIRAAHGEYISFLDADDIWMKDYLETIDGLIQKYPESDLFVTAYRILLGDKKVRYSRQLEPKEGCLDSYWRTLVFPYDFVWTSATTVRKSAAESAGLFLDGEKVGQDLDLWARIAEKNPKVAYSSKVCVDYKRFAEHNARSRNKIACASAFMRDLEKQLANPDRDQEERQAIQYKYDLKKTVHVYTCLLCEAQEEAEQAMADWKGRNSPRQVFLRLGLRVAGILPARLLQAVYRFRLKVF